MFHKGIARGLLAAALCAVGFAATAAEPEAVQLWEGGPYWATVNVGTPEQEVPAEYGALYKFNDDEAKNAAESLGDGWRLPTEDEFQALITNCGKGTWTEQNGVKGCLFTGTGDYQSNSIFLPAAGYDFFGDGGRLGDGEVGLYLSSDAGDQDARDLGFDEDGANVSSIDRSVGLSVRAVKDPPSVTGPSVKVDKVEAGEPWSKITVNYTLGGVDAATKYKVAFDVTAGGQTASVTNDAAKLTDGAATKEIDTATLFGKEVVDTKAKVKVSLIAVKPKEIPAGQLWEGGPIWAEANLGTPEAHDPAYPAEYGALYTFNDAAKAVTDALGGDWRLPTYEELRMLAGANKGSPIVCSNVWTTCNGVGGRRFFGMTPGYEDKSIFLPGAGFNIGNGRSGAGKKGTYWSSVAGDNNDAYYLSIRDSGKSLVTLYDLDDRCSVRAVRDAK